MARDLNPTAIRDAMLQSDDDPIRLIDEAIDALAKSKLKKGRYYLIRGLLVEAKAMLIVEGCELKT
jgi:hypothetical protein